MRTILSILFISIITQTVFSQENNIKLSISELFVLRPTIQYERVLNESMTAQLSIGFRLNRSLNPSITDAIALSNDDSEINLSNYAIIPEFRFYSKKKIAPEGFYIGLFGKFAKTNIDYNDINITNQEAFPGNISGNVKINGVGFMMGYQLLFSEKVSLDFNFIGFGIANYKISSSFVSTNSSITSGNYEAIATELSNEFNDYNVLDNLLKVSATDESILIEGKSLGPMLKFNITLGFAF